MGIEVVGLLLAAFFAGFVDAIAGGGGLIQVPALLAALPGVTPAVLFGTNKVSSIFGTATATWRYLRRVPVDWAVALPATISAFVASFVGAACIAWLPAAIIRPVVFVLLILVIVYVTLQPTLGLSEQRLGDGRSHRWMFAVVVGLVLGFYDGFFGPGTGSFLIFCFVRFFGMNFLGASSTAKIVNLATNAAALCFFLPSGNVLLGLGLGMALANILGAQVGAYMALRGGSIWVRRVFLLVSGVLVIKVGLDIF